MKKYLLFILLMTATAGLRAQEQRLVYCSYAQVGMAALGTDYCELIVDSGVPAKVVVAFNSDSHMEEMKKGEYQVEDSVVAQLQQLLKDLPLDRLNGYLVEGEMRGGHGYRINVRYADGRSIYAFWHTHDPRADAVEAYRSIERFFSPWRKELRSTLANEK